MKYSPKLMQEQLDKNNFYFKKKFGQNFIIDENIIKKIVSKAEIDENTIVIEIGPGSGSLTAELLKYAKQVICFEIDETLKEILKFDNKNIVIYYEDFLKADLKSKIIKKPTDKLYVVANLPYNITTPIITKIIEDGLDVDKMVLMVQKEVGNRLKAKPGSKDYSSLSIYLDYYFDVNKLMDVSRNVFMPKPNVDSIIVLFKKKDIKLLVHNEELFFKLVRDSFKQKRKNIRNNLINYNQDILIATLNKYKFDLNARAEQLSIDFFVEMANKLYDN